MHMCSTMAGRFATLWYTDPLGCENKTTWDCMCLKVFIFGMPIRLSYTFSFSCETDAATGKTTKAEPNPRRPMFGERQHRTDALWEWDCGGSYSESLVL